MGEIMRESHLFTWEAWDGDGDDHCRRITLWVQRRMLLVYWVYSTFTFYEIRCSSRKSRKIGGRMEDSLVHWGWG